MSDPISIGHKPHDLSDGLFQATLLSPNPPKNVGDTLNLTDYKKSAKADPILYWGEKNNYPQELDAILRKCGVLEAGLLLSGDYLIGQGTYLYTEFLDADNQVQQKIILDTEISDELDSMGYENYRHIASRDYLKWGNIWPIYKMNDGRDIVQIKIHDSIFCRLEKPNASTAEIENMYVSGQWANLDFAKNADAYAKQLKQWVTKYKMLKDFQIIAQMEAQPQVFDFAQHIKLHTSGSYYGRVPWHAVYESGWVDISVSVPQMKRRLFKNSMTLNYIVKVHEDYWKQRYSTWANMTPKEKEEAIKSKQREIEDNLVGESKAYKTLFISYKTDPRSGAAVYSLEIELVDNKLKEGTHIPDAQIADAQIVFALLVDPSLFGMSAPGSSNQTGSGSNIREASLALQARLKPHQDLINQPFYVIAEQKGWKARYKGLKIGTKGYVINTLDQKAASNSKTTTAK